MGLKDFLKKISKSEYQVVIDKLINELTPVLNDHSFRFNNIYTLSKNQYSDVTWTLERTDKYFQLHLHKLSRYYRLREEIPEATSDYELTMIMGEGGHDFDEKKWSALPLNLITKEAKEIYRFNNLEELTYQLFEIKNSLKNTLSFFLQDFDYFLETRKKVNLEKFVNQSVAFDKNKGWEEFKIDQKGQNFKDKYTK
jgi:hypothetical protein